MISYRYMNNSSPRPSHQLYITSTISPQAHSVRTIGDVYVPVSKFFDESDKTRHYGVQSTGEGEEEKEGE